MNARDKTIDTPLNQTDTQKIEGSWSLLKQSWHFFRNNWLVLSSIVLLPTFINYIIGFITGYQQANSPILYYIFTAISFAISIIMAVAIISAVHKISTNPGSHISLVGQYKIGIKSFWAVFLVSIISAFSTMGAALLFLIPAIIVSVYITFNVFALVIDGKRGLSAFMESYSIVRGRLYDVFMRLFVLGLLVFLVYIIVGIIYFLIALLFGVNISKVAINHTDIPLFVSIIGFVLNLVMEAVIGSVTIIFSYRLYVSLKASRKIDVSTVNFRRWMIAFLILGPIVLAMILVSRYTLNSSINSYKANQFENSIKLQAQLQKMSNNSSSTTLPKLP